MTDPASVSGHSVRIAVDGSRHANSATRRVICARGNVGNSANLPSHSNRKCKKELIDTTAFERKGSNNTLAPQEDSAEEFEKPMDYRGELCIDTPVHNCRRLQLPSPHTSPVSRQTCTEVPSDSLEGRRLGCSRTISNLERCCDLRVKDSSSETSILNNRVFNQLSKSQCGGDREYERCWKSLSQHSVCIYMKHGCSYHRRESISMPTDIRHLSSRRERFFSADGQFPQSRRGQILQEKRLDIWEIFRTSYYSCNKQTRSNKRLQAKGNSRRKAPSKLDLSKVNDLRNGRKTAKGPLYLILSWIITSMGFLLNCCRTFACSATYRKSNGLTRNCITFALWTLVILPGDSKRVLGNSLLISPGQFCTRARNLNVRQQEICENHSSILKHVEEGVMLGSHRCQKEFQYNRWNCSSSPRSFYSRLLIQDVRETAYVTAITSAAVTYVVTYACSKGEIPDCGCAENGVDSYELLKKEAAKRNVQVSETQLREAAAAFEWGGCSDVVEYGERISEIFTNNFGRRHQGKDLKGKIEEHNLEAGRLAITNHMRQNCRCHGLTGSCTLTTCWEKMPKWQDVGVRIRAQFDQAVRVQLANDGRELLRTRKQRLAIKEYPVPRQPYPDLSLSRRMKRASPGIYSQTNNRRSAGDTAVETGRRRRRRKRHGKGKGRGHGGVVRDENLVYSQESPNFCRRVRKHGTLGTSGRRCIPNATGAGSCDYMCCGRSYTQRQVTVTNRCNCRLEYCCKVICEECTTQETIYTCD